MNWNFSLASPVVRIVTLAHKSAVKLVVGRGSEVNVQYGCVDDKAELRRYARLADLIGA